MACCASDALRPRRDIQAPRHLFRKPPLANGYAAYLYIVHVICGFRVVTFERFMLVRLNFRGAQP